MTSARRPGQGVLEELVAEVRVGDGGQGLGPLPGGLAPQFGGPVFGHDHIGWIVGAMAVGGSIGVYAARTVQMTQMPELVALMHSLVGLAAVLVGYASYVDPSASAGFTSAEVTIHHVEVYIGVLIGAVTLSGSLIAFGKLSARISGTPLILPGKHFLNLAGLLLVLFFGAPRTQSSVATAV